jgi:hypothetical protein
VYSAAYLDVWWYAPALQLGCAPGCAVGSHTGYAQVQLVHRDCLILMTTTTGVRPMWLSCVEDSTLACMWMDLTGAGATLCPMPDVNTCFRTVYIAPRGSCIFSCFSLFLCRVTRCILLRAVPVGC